MAARWYCVQWCHSTKGWIDVPSLAFIGKKEADNAAEAYAHKHMAATRAIRKPHGWAPEAKDTEEPRLFHDTRIEIDEDASRQVDHNRKRR